MGLLQPRQSTAGLFDIPQHNRPLRHLSCRRVYFFNGDWFGKGFDVMVFNVADGEKLAEYPNFGGERAEVRKRQRNS